MVGLRERAKEKLAGYRDEAALRRGVPTGLLRSRLAAALRTLAGRLEPAAPPAPVQGGRTSSS